MLKMNIGRVGDGGGEANNWKRNSSARTFYNDLRSDKICVYYEEQTEPEDKVSQRARQHHNVVFVLSSYLYKLTFNFHLADPFVHDARNSHFELLFLSL